MERNFRPEQTTSEKIARMVTGPETEASHLVVDGQRADEIIHQQRVTKFNQDVKELQDKLQEHIDQIQEAGMKIAQDLNNLEIMPLTSYALITPFKTNPFQVIQQTNGIITDLGGLTPTYKSEEDGEVKEEEAYVKVGMVVETGANCKFVKPGDIVFYNTPSEVQVPFFRFGFVVVNEQRIFAVVNEGLTQRKDEIKNQNTD